MTVRTFLLPDLGEGLQEAEIVTWHVKEGDAVRADQPLASVETAKAVVDVPAPWTGRITKIHAAAGSILPIKTPLVDIDVAEDLHAVAPTQGRTEPRVSPSTTTETDRGTVVGSMPSSEGEVEETMIVRRRIRPAPPPLPVRETKHESPPSRGTSPSGQVAATTIKALPRVRRLARERGIDLQTISGSGPRGAITLHDLETQRSRTSTVVQTAAHRNTPPAGQTLRGPRRAMAQTMALARDTIAATTLFDDADIDAWSKGEDITVRIIRAIAMAVREVPVLNAWYDGDRLELVVHDHLDLALAVDTPDGLIVPVIRDAGSLDPRTLRSRLDDIKTRTRARQIAPEDMRHATLTLSNFGMMAGRYATPVVVPPMVAIVGTGRLCHDVVAVMGGIACHRRLPLSLTFDHRAVTGGDACRFLAAMIRDLERND